MLKLYRKNIIFLSIHTLTFLSKTRRKKLGIGGVIEKCVLSQFKRMEFSRFSLGHKMKTNDQRIVKVSMPILEAGKNWMTRSVLRQSSSSLRRNIFEKWLLILVNYSNLALANKGSKRSSKVNEVR